MPHETQAADLTDLSSSTPRVGFISTWPPTRCGIATYSRRLVRSLIEDHGLVVEVLGDVGASPEDPLCEVEPVFERGGRFAAPIITAAKRRGLDLVHIQHAPDLFGMGRELFALLDGLRSNGIRSVVTLHTVYDRMSGLLERKPHAQWFHRGLARRADALVVHQEMMQRSLEAQGATAAPIVVAAHGTDRMAPGDGQRIRDRHGVPAGAPLLLIFGFVHIQKNVQVAIQAMPELLASVPDAQLLIAGQIATGSWFNEAYAKHLDRIIRVLGLEDRVHVTRDFVDAGDVEDTYSAADIVLLPYNQGYGSASVVVHQAIGASKPLLCSDVHKFAEIKSEVSRELMLPATDPSAWARAITRMLADRPFREAIVERLRHHAEATSWRAVSAEQLALYQRLCPP